jgi:MFS family permease
VDGRIRRRLDDSFGAFTDVFANPNLRRVELAWAGTNIGRWAYFVALAVYAYEQGGAAAVGLVALIRMFPSAIVAPFTAILGDRYPRKRVMFLASTAQALTVAGASAVALADGPALLVYTFVGLNTMSGTAFRPAQAAILPTLARTPQELTAANVVASTVESIGIFIGPAIGGTLLAISQPGVVFALTAATFVWSAFLVARLDVPPEVPHERSTEGKLRQAFAGFGTILSNRPLRLLEIMAAGQTLVAGAFNVLVVVAALQLLDIGSGGVGLLNSAVGVGGLLGAALAALLVGRERLASHFAFGMLLWGIPIALIGIFPNSVVALPLLIVVGIGNTIVDVAGLTMLQRAVPDNVRARVFGAVNSLTIATLGLGAVLAPVMISLIGVRGALIVTGALLPILTALLFRGLAQLDTGALVAAEKLDLLRSNPIFAPLPEAALESLAAKLAEVRAPAGDTIFRQGDYGDRYYLIADGEVEVAVDGQKTRTLGPGEGFGEIALLRDVPRTATVTAVSDVTLDALERDDFIPVITGHSDSADRADQLIASRVGTMRPELLGSV